MPHRELSSPIPLSDSIKVLTSLIPYSASELILQILAIGCILVGEGCDSHRPIHILAMSVMLGGGDWSIDRVRSRAEARPRFDRIGVRLTDWLRLRL